MKCKRKSNKAKLKKKLKINLKTKSLNKRSKEKDLNNSPISIYLNINVNNNTNNTVNIKQLTKNNNDKDFEQHIDHNNKKEKIQRCESNNSENIFTMRKIKKNPVEKEKMNVYDSKEINTTTLMFKPITFNAEEMLVDQRNESYTPKESSSGDCENDYSSIYSESSIEDDNNFIEEELTDTIKSLLFYKIDMPASSSNKFIITSLEQIQIKLGELKNCHTYYVTINIIKVCSLLKI